MTATIPSNVAPLPLRKLSEQVDAAVRELDRLYPGTTALLLVPLNAQGVAEKGAIQGAMTRYTSRATPRRIWLRKMGQHHAKDGSVGWVIPPGWMATAATDEAAIAAMDKLYPKAPMMTSEQAAVFVVPTSEDRKIRKAIKSGLVDGSAVELRPGGNDQTAPLIVEPSRSDAGIWVWERGLPEKLKRSPGHSQSIPGPTSPSKRPASTPDRGNPEDGFPTVEPPIGSAKNEERNEPDDQDDELLEEGLVTWLETVEQKRWEWLLPGRIPFGAITGITGPPGMGKGVAVHDLIAKLSAGKELPDGTKHKAITTLLLTREDNPSKTLKPRLQMAGADLGRIGIWNRARCADGKLRPPNIVDHLGTLARLVDQSRARVVVVDPFMTFLGHDRNAFSPQEMADAMTNLQEHVAEMNVAMVIVNHPPKGTGRTAIERFMGTMSTTGVIRMLFEVRPDPADPDRRLLAQSKSNLAEPVGALAYRIREGFVDADDGGEPISTACVDWLGVQEGVTAQSLDAREREGQVSPRTEKAMEFLAVQLAKADSPKTGVALGKLIDLAKEREISIGALYDGFRELGAVGTPKSEYGGTVRWYIPKAEVA